jgi:uncharacterized protein (DUF488 family)
VTELLTIGHSTHELRSFEQLLSLHGVTCVADVRRFPASRRSPHFDREPLRRALAVREVSYEHLPELGGRRRTSPASANDGWTNHGFRGYADHMATADFARGLRRLEEIARSRPTAVMCAEGSWWRCHRRLVADALLVRGWSVHHIAPDGRLSAHELTPFAAVEGTRITYPTPTPRLPVG